MSSPSREVAQSRSLSSINGVIKVEASDGHVVESDPEVEETAPPDGGWGWVVCLSCFLVHVLADGIFYSFGVIYVELLLYFGQGKGETAWISSLANGMCFFSGPLSAVLTDQFGCRRVAIAGAFILSGSLVISSFAPNIYFLFFSFGILAGTGYGLVYLPSIVCVTTYFRKRRALATGIGVSGSGVGTFIFGPAANYFLNEYGWRGAMLLFGGISLNCLVCAMSFLPLPVEKQKQLIALDISSKTTKQNAVNDEIDEASNMLESSFNEKRDTNCDCKTSHFSEKNTEEESEQFSQNTEKQLSASDIKVISSSRTSLHLINNDTIKTVSDLKSFKEILLDNIKVSLDPELFKNIPFTVFLISTMLYSFGYYIPYIFLPDTASQIGLTESQGAWLIAIIGITNTTGRVIFGAMADRKCISRLFMYSCALVICGVATSLGPLFVTFPTLVLYAVIFGSSSGVTVSLTSVLIADLVGIQKLAGAFGIINFFCGIFIVAGPPIVGRLFDVTGSYHLTYLVAGLTICASGAILFIIPCLRQDAETNHVTRSHHLTYLVANSICLSLALVCSASTVSRGGNKPHDRN